MTCTNEIIWKLEYDGYCGKADRWFGGDIEIEISESKLNTRTEKKCKTKVIGRKFGDGYLKAILLDLFWFDTFAQARAKGNEIINTKLDHYRDELKEAE